MGQKNVFVLPQKTVAFRNPSILCRPSSSLGRFVFIRIPEVFGKDSPTATVLGDVLQGAEKGEIRDFDIATLFRKQMCDAGILCLC